MRKTDQIKAIYFDLDDTLCGYWAASSKALLEAFETHKPGNYTPDEMIEHWAAAFREFIPEIKTEKWYPAYLANGEVTRTEQMRRALAHAGIPNDALASEISETYMRKRNAHLRLFPDVVEVLDVLVKKYPLGLITNGPADIQRMEIEQLGIGHYFKNFFIEGEVGFGKPELEVFRRAATAVNLPPEQLMFVGNSYAHDMAPAIVAGWTSVWVRKLTDIPPSQSGDHSKLEELPAGKPAPDFEIQNLSELFEILSLAHSTSQ
jgi:HAD superfamily hydrolase (TIGR01549 family)